MIKELRRMIRLSKEVIMKQQKRIQELEEKLKSNKKSLQIKELKKKE